MRFDEILDISQLQAFQILNIVQFLTIFYSGGFFFLSVGFFFLCKERLL